MRKINKWFVRRYISWQQKSYTYEDEEHEKVCFALMTILSELEKIILLGTIFICLGKGMEFFLSIVALVGIRRYTGGFHAKTILGCTVLSFLYISTGIWMSEHIEILEKVEDILYIMMACTIYSLTPLKSAKRPEYNVEQRLYMKVKGLWWLIIIRVIGRVLHYQLLIVSILTLQQIEIILKCLIERWEVKCNNEKREEGSQSGTCFAGGRNSV